MLYSCTISMIFLHLLPLLVQLVTAVAFPSSVHLNYNAPHPLIPTRTLLPYSFNNLYQASKPDISKLRPADRLLYIPAELACSKVGLLCSFAHHFYTSSLQQESTSWPAVVSAAQPQVSILVRGAANVLSSLRNCLRHLMLRAGGNLVAGFRHAKSTYLSAASAVAQLLGPANSELWATIESSPHPTTLTVGPSISHIEQGALALSGHPVRDLQRYRSVRWSELLRSLVYYGWLVDAMVNGRRRMMQDIANCAAEVACLAREMQVLWESWVLGSSPGFLPLLTLSTAEMSVHFIDTHDSALSQLLTPPSLTETDPEASSDSDTSSIWCSSDQKSQDESESEYSCKPLAQIDTIPFTRSLRIPSSPSSRAAAVTAVVPTSLVDISPSNSTVQAVYSDRSPSDLRFTVPTRRSMSYTDIRMVSALARSTTKPDTFPHSSGCARSFSASISETQSMPKAQLVPALTSNSPLLDPSTTPNSTAGAEIRKPSREDAITKGSRRSAMRSSHSPKQQKRVSFIVPHTRPDNEYDLQEGAENLLRVSVVTSGLDKLSSRQLIDELKQSSLKDDIRHVERSLVLSAHILEESRMSTIPVLLKPSLKKLLKNALLVGLGVLCTTEDSVEYNSVAESFRARDIMNAITSKGTFRTAELRVLSTKALMAYLSVLEKVDRMKDLGHSTSDQ